MYSVASSNNTNSSMEMKKDLQVCNFRNIFSIYNYKIIRSDYDNRHYYRDVRGKDKLENPFLLQYLTLGDRVRL